MRWFGRDKKKSSSGNTTFQTARPTPLTNTTVKQARQNPGSLQPQQVQQLQSTIGNRELSSLMGRHRANNENLPANRYQFTMGVKGGEENFIAKSTLFTIKKYAHRMGLGNKKPVPPSGTGHAWIVMKRLHDNVLLDNNSYGFTPGGFQDPDPYRHESGEGVFYKDHNISEETYNLVQERLQNIKEKSESGELKYNVLGYNCTAFVRDIAKTAKVPFPGSKVLPFAFHGPASAFTPNKLQKALKKQQKKRVPGVRNKSLPNNIIEQQVNLDWVKDMRDRMFARYAAEGREVDPAMIARMNNLLSVMDEEDGNAPNVVNNVVNENGVNDTDSEMDMDDILESVMERNVEDDGPSNTQSSGGLSEEIRAQLIEQFGIVDDDEDMLESDTEQQVEEGGPSNTQSQAPTTEKKTNIAALLDMFDEEGIESELEEDEEEEPSHQEDEESEEEWG